MRRLRKIFYIATILILTIIAGSGIAVVMYKDSIIDLLKNEINKNIKTELEVESIDLKLLKGFPNISIQFSGVKFHSIFGDELLLESDQIYFVLNLIDLYYNDITIERLEIENATIVIHKNKKGENNFNVFVNSDTVARRDNGKLDIKSTNFLNVKIINIDDTHEIYDVIKINTLYGAASFIDSIYYFDVATSSTIEKTNYAYLKWLLGKRIFIETNLTYDGRELNFKPSKLILANSEFNFKGNFNLSETQNISIKLKSTNIKFAELITLFSKKQKEALRPFRGKGVIGIDAHLEGDFGAGSWPSLTVDFSLNKFQISSKKLEYPLEDIQLIGRLQMPNIQNLKTAKLDVLNFSARAKKNKFKINGSIANLSNPQIKGKVEGDFDASWVMSVIDPDAKNIGGKSSGLVNLDFETDFNLQDVNGYFEIDKSIINGSAKFYSLSIDSLFSLPLKNINGELLFSNNKINLHKVEGYYGASNFMIDGSVSTKKREDKLEGNLVLESSLLNLDEIIEVLTKSATDSSKKVNLKLFKFNVAFMLQVEKVIFEKFKGENLRADLVITQNGLKINKATSNGMSGDIALTGAITSQFNGDFYIEAKVRTREVELDSLFYVFNNFNQSFITDSVIKGKLFSDVYTSMYFDKEWKFKRELLYAEGLLKVRKGELNNFEPMMSLSTYLKNEDENLAKLRFSNLESSIIISSDTVFISDMYIGSNVRDIKIGGFHTLDQQIEYRLSVPVMNNKKDKDSEFGEIKTDQAGKLYMPFKITGTTSDYKVNYDLAKAGSNLAKGIKKELIDLGSSLKMKEPAVDKVDTLVLEEEFFDWDNE